MTAPDRPTREQVDAAPHKAAALLLGAAHFDPTLRAAAEQVQDALIAQDAEVRALRAELVDALDVAERLRAQRDKLHQDVACVAAELTARADGPALAARTPHPAGGGVVYRCDQSRHPVVPCSRCELVTSVPLPAVSDGEDAAHLRDQLDRAQALIRKQHRELVQLTMVPPSPFGEDVPARLDAAAEALEKLPDSRGGNIGRQAARHLRRAADWLNAPSPGPLRAAVAAALALPPGGEPRG